MSDALSPVSQLLQRSESLFAGKHLLVSGFLEDNYLLDWVSEVASLTLFTTDYHRYRELKAHRLADRACIRFGHVLPDDQHGFDALLLLLPKAKAEAQYLLANLTPALQTGADLFLAGENRGGINGADKLLAAYSEQSRKLDSARRCSLVHAELTQPAAPFVQADWVQQYALPLGDAALRIQALPGVFSADELDEGTALLLAHLPDLQGRVLDIGCGAGVIGSYIAHRYPDVQIEMCDINALALESARLTLAANGLSGQVYASDMLSDVSGPLQQVVTNPPFHAGLKTLYAPTEQLILGLPAVLAPQGGVLLVANAFLKYPPFLERAFKHCRICAENSRFKVYACQ